MNARAASGAFAVLAASALLNARPAPAEHRGHAHDRQHGNGLSVSVDDEGEVRECRDLRIRYHDYETARDQETLTIRQGDAPTLKIRAATNGGIRVQGWDRREYAVTACKAAPGEDADAARRVLSQISLSFANGELTVHGPPGDGWTAYLLISAPRDAALSLEATNGGIGLGGLSGKVTAISENGPISLRENRGEIDVQTENGPISVKEGGGTMRLRAENGPISVSIASRRWEGGSLRAQTQNGPVSLRVPDDFESGVLLEASSHSPVSCRGAHCQDARRDSDSGKRRIEFGGPNPALRLSTVNGPISVDSRAKS